MDEYQDINAAQDKYSHFPRGTDILTPRPAKRGRAGARLLEKRQNLLTPPPPPPAEERERTIAASNVAGNRFLVGDVKQSIYRFRLADPKIFRDYSKTWHGRKRSDDSADGKFSQPRKPAGFCEFGF